MWSGLTRENNQGALPHLRIGANRLQNHFSWDFQAFPASEQRGSGMASPGGAKGRSSACFNKVSDMFMSRIYDMVPGGNGM